MLDFTKYISEPIDYPTKPIKPENYDNVTKEELKKYWKDCNEYSKAMITYSEKRGLTEKQNREQFKKDLLEDLGLTNHPKAETIYTMSVDRYITFEDVYNFAKKLSELIH